MGRPAPQDIAAILTDLLFAKRRRRGLSHEALAERSGVHRSTVSRVEADTMNATLLVFLALAEALDLHLGDLIGRAERRAGRKRSTPKPQAAPSRIGPNSQHPKAKTG